MVSRVFLSHSSVITSDVFGARGRAATAGPVFGFNRRLGTFAADFMTYLIVFLDASPIWRMFYCCVDGGPPLPSLT